MSEIPIESAIEDVIRQFADPLAFFRELIQNSIDAGSGEVEVTLDRDPESGDVTISVMDWGEGMTREIIESKLVRLFSSGKDEDLTKIGKFGIGFVSVLAIEPEVVSIDTGRDGEYWRLLLFPDRTWELVELGHPVEGTEVRLHTSMSAEDFESFRKRAREAVHDWCRFVSVPVRFDGEDVRRPFELEGIIVEKFTEEGTRAVVAVREDYQCRGSYFNAGLALQQVPSQWPHLEFILDSRYLEHTLTRDRVIEDKSFHRAIDILNELVDETLSESVADALRTWGLNKDRVWDWNKLGRIATQVFTDAARAARFPTTGRELVGVAQIRQARKRNRLMLCRGRAHFAHQMPDDYLLLDIRPDSGGARLVEYVLERDVPVLEDVWMQVPRMNREDDDAATAFLSEFREVLHRVGATPRSIGWGEFDYPYSGVENRAFLSLPPPRRSLPPWRRPAVRPVHRRRARPGQRRPPGRRRRGGGRRKRAGVGRLPTVQGGRPGDRVRRARPLHPGRRRESGDGLPAAPPRPAGGGGVSESIADRLRGAGEIARSGKLEVDRARARDKLCRFRLANPYLYVLQFVRAASLAGATRIDFEIDADEMECVFDVPIPRQVVSELWTRAYGTRTEKLDHVAYQLALGLGSAQALRPREVLLQTSLNGGATLRLTTGLEELEVGCGDFGEGTRVYVREKFRLGHLVEFLQPDDSLPEIEFLNGYCAASSLRVTVNGEQVSHGRGVPGDDRYRFDDDVGRGELKITLVNDFGIHLLKHDVWLGRWSGTADGVGVTGRIDSPLFETDLSDMGLVRDSGFRQLARQIVFGKYHRAVTSALDSEVPLQNVLTLMKTVAGRLVDETNEGERSVAATWELGQALLDAPTWSVVTDPTAANSFNDLVSDVGVLEYASTSVPEAMSEFDRVLFIPPITTKWSNMPQRRLYRSAFGALCRLTQTTPVDVEEKIASALERRTNRLRWLARPQVTDPPDAAYIENVTIGGLRAWAYVPRGDQAKVLVRIDGRHVAERPAQSEFSVAMDGDFEPDETFTGIVVNEEVERLAVELSYRLPAIAEALAEDVLAGRAENRPDFLRRWVLGCAEGTAQFRFLKQCGLDTDRISTLLADTTQSVPQASGLWGRPMDELISALGAVARVPLYEVLGHRAESLEELAEMRHLAFIPSPDFAPQAHQRSLQVIESTRADHPEDVDDLTVVVADEHTCGLLQRFFGAPHALHEIRRRRNKREFLQRPRFNLHEPDAEVLHTLVADDIELRLLAGLQRLCRVHFVYRERLLDTYEFETSLGYFDAVIRSNSLTPGDDGTDVDDQTVGNYIGILRSLTNQALEAWRSRCIETGELPGDIDGRALYFRACAERVPREPTRPMFPVVRVESGELERELCSHAALERMARGAGNCLAVATSNTIEPDMLERVGTPAIELAVGLSIVRDLFPGMRIVDVSQRDDRRARAHWLANAKPFALDFTRSPVVARIDRDGIEGQVGWDPSNPTGNPGTLGVHVLYEDRLLETLVVRAPFGRFRAIVHGSPIRPDPDYTFVAGGRAQVLRAALHGVVACIRKGCRQLPEAPKDTVDALRPDLWRLIRTLGDRGLKRPFDELRDLLDEPIVEMTSGRWIAASRFDEIGRGTALPYAEEGSSDHVLYLPRPHLKLAREAVGRWSLVEAKELGVPLHEASSNVDMPLLERVASLLVQAREDREHLFDDYLARGMDWAERPMESLCRVDDDGIRVTTSHPLVTAVIERPDDLCALAFLASTIYSEVNRYYLEISDHDELTLQRQLLELLRP